MDLSEHCGRRNSGVLYMKQTIKISDSSFQQLKSIFQSTENKDITSIYKLTESLKHTEQYLTENFETIIKLKQYFTEQFRKHFDLEHIAANYHKEGVYTLLTYFFAETNFGKFLAEKLDTEHILTGKINYPVKIKKGTFIRFSLGKQNTKQEIDLLILSIKKLIYKT
jgi:cysteine sulfinate desulfinase/cysteine desulfurase-like protein